MKLDKLYAILKRVEKPGRYLGNEVNVIRKNFAEASVRVALVFPDLYEIGMSHMGLKILYDILNKIPGVVAERCYAPGLDLEAELIKENLPLFSLESKRPLADFDIIGFSLTYELTYTNMVNILNLAQIPIWQKDRNDSHPLIIAGGGCTTNAEPVADFLDAACLGDGEEMIVDVVNALIGTRVQGLGSRVELLDALSQIDGVYVPSFFTPIYNDDGTLKETKPLKEGYTKINRRVLKEIDTAPYPTATLVPNVRPVHDRIGIEIQRGCNRACRFCQAGYIDRPVRQRSPETVLRIAEESYQQTGIDAISLLSLSAADYACLVPLLAELNDRYARRKVSLSVPATRVEKMTPELVEQIKQVRKTGFTIAPEAGSPRMRRVINKGNKVEDLYQAVTNAFSQGWQTLKMYYMVGLPFENEDDVLGIARESRDCLGVARRYNRGAELNTSVSSFVPKPHTPFQWEPQMTIAETRAKHDLVKRNLGDRKIRFKHHNPEMSYLEGILSRGDRRVGQLLYLAWSEGARFDEWAEHFDFSKWQTAFTKWEMDPAFYLHRKRPKEEVLPWDHLFAQMEKKFLWEEYEKAHDEAFTEDCSVQKCSDCGVCDFRKIKNRIYVVGDEPVMAKKGNREAYGWQRERQIPLDPPFSKGEKDAPPFEKGGMGGIFKIRCRFSKTGEAKFLGHLELMNGLRRAITRLGVPIRFTEGFHPQMKLSMGHALSLGIESEWEFFDLEFSEAIDLPEFQQKLNSTLPGGVAILSVEKIDSKEPSLYARISSLSFEASFEDQQQQWSPEALSKLGEFEASDTFYWAKEKGKPLSGGQGPVKPQSGVGVDLKKMLLIDKTFLPQTIKFKTSVSPAGTIKPQEAIRAMLGLTAEELSRVRIVKSGLETTL